MNEIAVQGYLRDIEFSHDVGKVDYNKASLICPGVNGKEDELFLIQFKKLSNKYNEGDFVEFKGNLRSYTTRGDGGKSQVQIYIFTYFDLPDIPINTVKLDGRICKITELKTSYSGTSYIHFIIANNIFKGGTKLNSYIPCTAYGEVAERLSKNTVNDFISIDGRFHSHTYKRKSDNEIMLAHEVIVKDYEVVNG